MTTTLGCGRVDDSDTATLAALSQLGSWAWDVAADSITWSQELNDLFGFDRDHQPRNFYDYLELLDPGEREQARAAVEISLRTHEPFDFIHRRSQPDGSGVWIRSRGGVVCQEGVPVRVVGISHEVTAQKVAEEDLLRLAFHDALTGLANRILFSQRLATALARL
jgi:PAS domain-containing protein